MPRLLLLRHAKSTRDDPRLADIDRPLAPRGRRQAAMAGDHIASHGLLPDRVLCSLARRTRETLACLLPHLAAEAEIRLTGALYGTDWQHYRQLIAGHGGDSRRLLVIGHNPSIQELAVGLAGSGNPALMAAMAAGFPTAGLAVIDFDAGWREVRPKSGRVVAFYRPQDLEIVGSPPAADE